MIPLFAGPHLVFLADWLGFCLKTVCSIHQSAGWMMAALVLHTIAAVSDGPLPLDIPQNMFVVIVSILYNSPRSVAKSRQAVSLLCILIVLLFPLFRHLSYELFLWSHQALALVFTYTVWRYLPSDKSSPRVYIYICTVIFGLYPSCRAVPSMSGTKSSVTTCHGPQLATTRVRSRCSYTSRRR